MKQTNRFDKNFKVVDESSKNHNTNHLNGQRLEKNKENYTKSHHNQTAENK